MSKVPALGPRGEGWVVLQLILFVVIGAAGIGLPGSSPGGDGMPLALAGLLLLALSALLGVAGLAGLQGGNALTAVPHPREGARLIETGAYRLVRHPVYGALILGAIGWSFVRASAAALLASLALAIVLDLKRRREEAWLADRYPGYPAYASRTRRLIPWIW
ncbi:MAG: isoprenylcysteine carboxylmethyltransferase family protein [Chloroflexota bacterium]